MSFRLPLRPRYRMALAMIIAAGAGSVFLANQKANAKASVSNSISQQKQVGGAPPSLLQLPEELPIESVRRAYLGSLPSSPYRNYYALPNWVELLQTSRQWAQIHRNPIKDRLKLLEPKPGDPPKQLDAELSALLLGRCLSNRVLARTETLIKEADFTTARLAYRIAPKGERAACTLELPNRYQMAWSVRSGELIDLDPKRRFGRVKSFPARSSSKPTGAEMRLASQANVAGERATYGLAPWSTAADVEGIALNAQATAEADGYFFLTGDFAAESLSGSINRRRISPDAMAALRHVANTYANERLMRVFTVKSVARLGKKDSFSLSVAELKQPERAAVRDAVMAKLGGECVADLFTFARLKGQRLYLSPGRVPEEKPYLSGGGQSFPISERDVEWLTEK